MGIRYIDGKRFRRAVVAGAEWVRQMREHLNRINVFPVPDGDTGTNMALSLSASADAAKRSDDDDLARASQDIAEASILGAKGNSGLIMAHWFLGFSKALGKKARIGAEDLAHALGRATMQVYEAIDKPQEGTILTVMREGSDAAARAAENGHDVGGIMDEFLDAAKAALKRTPEMLAILRESKVVDAGGQGFVHFFEGVKRTLEGAPPPVAREEDLHADTSHIAVSVEQLDGRYCTEVVVRGRNFDPTLLKARFNHLGSSMLLATTGEVFKLHIHTDHPDEVFHLAQRWGTIEERKVDDMLRQSEERQTHQQEPLVPLEQQPKTVAILCDSTCDLSAETRQEYGIEMAPLSILFGDEVYRDQIDLSTRDFYEKLLEDEHHPTTSQPPPREFVSALERIRSDREVIIVTLAQKLSGTYRSALSAARLVDHPRVEIFDSNTISVTLGMQVVCAARLAQRGASVDDILGWLKRWRERGGLLFTVATLDYLKKGGRIGTAAHLIGSLLRMRPVLTVMDGEVKPIAKVRGDDEAFEKVLSTFEEAVPADKRVRLGVLDSTEGTRLEQAEERVRERNEIVESFRGQITGVIGTHVGPGAWGLFYQIVEDDDPLT
jgi:hypothetical protein